MVRHARCTAIARGIVSCHISLLFHDA
jgi:hypothetical protein